LIESEHFAICIIAYIKALHCWPNSHEDILANFQADEKISTAYL